MSALAFVVEGRCVPWMRTASYGGRKLTPAKQRDYQRRTATSATMARGCGWPLDARYAVEIVVHEPDVRRRDLDNQAKTILDALNGVLWADDSSVDVLAVSRRLDRERPRVEVSVAAMTLTERDAVSVEIAIGT